MRLLLASPRGFCAGVTRAIDILDKVLIKFGQPVYVKHEIVHNKMVVKDFQRKGAIFVEEIGEIPDGSRIVLSAHGSARSVFDEAKRKNLHILDATCPLVSSVHKVGQRLGRNGCDVILIGHKNHAEVIGTVGQIDGNVVIIENEKDAEEVLINNPDRVGYITQTTLNVDDTKSIVEILQRRFPKIIGSGESNICYATKNRQDVIHKVAGIAEVILIVGSRNSSNSNRLKDVGKICSKGTYLIDTKDDIDPLWLKDIEIVGLSAGASAPEHLVQGVVQYLQENYNATIETIDGVEESVIFNVLEELN